MTAGAGMFAKTYARVLKCVLALAVALTAWVTPFEAGRSVNGYHFGAGSAEAAPRRTRKKRVRRTARKATRKTTRRAGRKARKRIGRRARATARRGARKSRRANRRANRRASRRATRRANRRFRKAARRAARRPRGLTVAARQSVAPHQLAAATFALEMGRIRTNKPWKCLPPQMKAILGQVVDRYGPLTINSTHRSPRHNRRVGGGRRSYHLGCRAVDFRVHGPTPGMVKWLTRQKMVGGYNRYPSGYYHIDTGPRRTW